MTEISRQDMMEKVFELFNGGIDNFRQQLAAKNKDGSYSFDVNMRTKQDKTLLHQLCQSSRNDITLSQFLQAMLSREDLEVNTRDDTNFTAFEHLLMNYNNMPLSISVMFTNSRVDDSVRIWMNLPLLRYRISHSTDDSRIKLLLSLGLERQKNGGGDCRQPVWLYGREGDCYLALEDPRQYDPNTFYHQSTRQLIAKPDSPSNRLRFTLELAGPRLSDELFKLLSDFADNPILTTMTLQMQAAVVPTTAATTTGSVGLSQPTDIMTTSVFSTLIFLSDGLLRIKTINEGDSGDSSKGDGGSSRSEGDNEGVTKGNKEASKAVRFFKMASQLPLELQMVLCHRLVRSPQEIIPFAIRELGFKCEAQYW